MPKRYNYIIKIKNEEHIVKSPREAVEVVNKVMEFNIMNYEIMRKILYANNKRHKYFTIEKTPIIFVK